MNCDSEMSPAPDAEGIIIIGQGEISSHRIIFKKIWNFKGFSPVT
jgi:hypothetical protein